MQQRGRTWTVNRDGCESKNRSYRTKKRNESHHLYYPASAGGRKKPQLRQSIEHSFVLSDQKLQRAVESRPRASVQATHCGSWMRAHGWRLPRTESDLPSGPPRVSSSPLPRPAVLHPAFTEDEVRLFQTSDHILKSSCVRKLIFFFRMKTGPLQQNMLVSR